MPESKPPRKKATTPATAAPVKVEGNPPWLVPTMLTLMILGLVWIVVTYVSQTDWPVPGIGNWNLAIGFVLLFAGFGLTLRWR
ncbi:septation inhibitor protein [Actinotalea ferrariae CF5-4]|uniref:Cell division protein CrgA n=1 Tax=Actinotalea ferrariae CF5-4 TaxID=948458 RepID=A0A021VP42_9CELL|nr:cell division protein CrgA [Actinotalea ferrariae]EYR62959.1 septation inhibitor protein [Actinotalea ferrariae CF5-4]